MYMKWRGYPLRIFQKVIYKFINTIHPKTKITIIEAKKFGSPTLMQDTQRIKPNSYEIKINGSWISSFANSTKINKKNVIKFIEDDKITIKLQIIKKH